MIQKLWQLVEDVKRGVQLLRNGLVRYGVVDSVDPVEGTLVVDYAGTVAKSYAMPWVQRSTENRIPPVGDHVIVLDPSLGSGQAVAIVGWVSQATPPLASGGSEVLYEGDSPVEITTSSSVTVASDQVDLGQAADFVALAQDVLNELQAVKTDLDAVKATFDAHVHITTATVGASATPGVLAPPAASIPPPHTPASVAAQHVKAS